MWWVLIPGAAAVAYKVYDAFRDKEPEDKTPPAASAPGELPKIGPRLRHWAELFGDPEKPPEKAPKAGASPRPPSRRPWLRPAHLTLATALALVAATVWQARAPAAWLDWTQAVLLGALIGIGTNWVAIKMLFRPKVRRFGLQGLIPANREQIAEQIAEGVAANLLDRETIRKAVHESNIVQAGLDEFVAGLQRVVRHAEFRKDFNELVVGYVSAFVNNEKVRQTVLDVIAGFARRAPHQANGFVKIFASEIGGWLETKVHQYRDAILRGLERQTPALVAEISDRLAKWLETLPQSVESRRSELERFITERVAARAASFDIQGIVRQRLEDYSPDDLEQLILSATEEHLTWLQILGWFIGALAAPLVRGLQVLLG